MGYWFFKFYIATHPLTVSTEHCLSWIIDQNIRINLLSIQINSQLTINLTTIQIILESHSSTAPLSPHFSFHLWTKDVSSRYFYALFLPYWISSQIHLVQLSHFNLCNHRRSTLSISFLLFCGFSRLTFTYWKCYLAGKWLFNRTYPLWSILTCKWRGLRSKWWRKAWWLSSWLSSWSAERLSFTRLPCSPC